MTWRAYWLVAGAYALLAVGAIVTLALIGRNAQEIKDEQGRLTDFAVNVTAAICMQAFAPNEDEAELVIRFVEGRPLPLRPEACRRAVALTRRQLEGD